MRYLILLLLFATPALAQPLEHNPHRAGTSRIQTAWDHKNITRLPGMADVMAEINDIQYAIHVNNGGNRGIMSHVVPFAYEPAGPGKPYTFGIFEDYQLERFNDPKGAVYSRTDSSYLTHYQHQYSTEGGRFKAETYVIWLQFDRDRDHFSFAPRFSAVNWVGFGADLIKVHGSGKIDLGPISILPANASTIPGRACLHIKDIVTEVNGEKYILVDLGVRQKYGLKLEKLNLD